LCVIGRHTRLSEIQRCYERVSFVAVSIPVFLLHINSSAFNSIIIIINRYLEAGLSASISIQHIYYKHELQQELYNYYYYIDVGFVIIIEIYI